MYNLNTSLYFDSNTKASEVRLYGSTNGSIETILSSASALLTLRAGAPQVTLHGIRMHGRLVVDDGLLLIEDCVVEKSTHPSDGGALSLTGGRAEVRNTWFLDNHADRGGAIAVDGGSLLLDNCRLDSNTATLDGGALYVRSGAVNLRSGTLLQGNSALSGNSLYIDGGTVQYMLPCSLGHYIKADYGKTSMLITASMAPINEDFPYTCSPGLYGNSFEEQTSAGCSGVCPEGRFCPVGTIHPQPCGGGNFCPGSDATGRRGATAALPCKAGTYSNESNLVRADECTKTDAGFYASTGSTEQTACATGTIAAEQGRGRCTPCGAGTYQNTTGAAVCKRCKQGYYCPTGASAPLRDCRPDLNPVGAGAFT